MATVIKNRTYGKIAGFWVIVNNIRNLTCGKNDQYSKIYLLGNNSKMGNAIYFKIAG
jgi:hypothetical protein